MPGRQFFDMTWFRVDPRVMVDQIPSQNWTLGKPETCLPDNMAAGKTGIDKVRNQGTMVSMTQFAFSRLKPCHNSRLGNLETWYIATSRRWKVGIRIPRGHVAQAA